MNIFVLDEDVEKCAQYHCDKHVVKMVLESAQLLCSAHAFYGEQVPYKMSKGHMNHPCAIWTRQSQDNYFFLWDLALNLADEYTYRYGKVHASEKVIKSLNWPTALPKGKQTPYARAFRRTMPADKLAQIEACKDTVQAYRMYYMLDKSEMCTWKGREVPEWFNP